MDDHFAGRCILCCLCLLGVEAAFDATEADAAVRRRLTVRSNPEGALVYVDDQQIGATPVSVSFTYYGTRKIQLIKDGFKTVTVRQTFSPPWYEIPPLDFFSENLYGGELRDEHVVDVQLEPETIPSTTELWERAEALRSSARAGVITPAAPVAPVVAAPVAPVAPFSAPAVVAPPPASGPATPAFSPVAPLPAPVPQRLPPPFSVQPPAIDPYARPAISPLPPP